MLTFISTTQHQTLLSPIVLTTIFTDFKNHIHLHLQQATLDYKYTSQSCCDYKISYKNTYDMLTFILTTQHQTLLSPIVSTTVFTDFKNHIHLHLQQATLNYKYTSQSCCDYKITYENMYDMSTFILTTQH